MMKPLLAYVFLSLIAMGCAGPSRELVTTTTSASSQTNAPHEEDLVVVDEEPVRLSMPKLHYPQAARKAGIEGAIFVRILVETDGRVGRLIVIDTIAELEAAAVDAARRSRWKPAQRDGQPIAVWVNMPLTFKLRDGK